MVQTERDKASIDELGVRIYHASIKRQLTDQQLNMLVAIDVNTGEYEVAESSIMASKRLRKRVPDADIFVLRHGPIIVGRIPRWHSDEVDKSWSRVR